MSMKQAVYITSFRAPMYLIDVSNNQVLSFHSSAKGRALEPARSVQRSRPEYHLYNVGDLWATDAEYLHVAARGVAQAVAPRFERGRKSLTLLREAIAGDYTIVFRTKALADRWMSLVSKEYMLAKRTGNGQSWGDPTLRRRILFKMYGEFVNTAQGESNMDPDDLKNREGIFIIGSTRSDGSLSFSSSPVQHNTWASAQAEADRLARTNPGKEFVVFRRAGSCSTVPVPQVTWKL